MLTPTVSVPNRKLAVGFQGYPHAGGRHVDFDVIHLKGTRCTYHWGVVGLYCDDREQRHRAESAYTARIPSPPPRLGTWARFRLELRAIKAAIRAAGFVLSADERALLRALEHAARRP